MGKPYFFLVLMLLSSAMITSTVAMPATIMETTSRVPFPKGIFMVGRKPAPM